MKKDIKTLYAYRKCLFHRNEFGIKNIRTPSKSNKVNIEHSFNKNIGDSLGPIIVNWLLNKEGIDPYKDVKETKHLLTVGSIIGWGRCDATVWGSGILKQRLPIRLKKHRLLLHRKLDFRAVRGPITRDMVLSSGYLCPAIYGDPAIIMPDIYFPNKANKEYNISVILHHRTELAADDTTDLTEYKISIPEDLINRNHIHFIDPKTYDYKFFIDEILKSRLVVSSSLHGIILAEAYGVPAIFLNWGMDDQPTKFLDWYHSTDRHPIECKSVEEAVNMHVPEVPDLSILKKDLFDSFPYDLWED